ncbi:hypothetical protein R3P38DRAFT_3166695 [Favolaschia claudopus]|uniref:C2H2-type domain-containing protein n=1 Tax=Favolaschia claudopus TaxID=2862362 RepID=A0AAW0E9J9_9AGAR
MARLSRRTNPPYYRFPPLKGNHLRALSPVRETFLPRPGIEDIQDTEDIEPDPDFPLRPLTPWIVAQPLSMSCAYTRVDTLEHAYRPSSDYIEATVETCAKQHCSYSAFILGIYYPHCSIFIANLVPPALSYSSSSEGSDVDPMEGNTVATFDEHALRGHTSTGKTAGRMSIDKLLDSPQVLDIVLPSCKASSVPGRALVFDVGLPARQDNRVLDCCPDNLVNESMPVTTRKAAQRNAIVHERAGSEEEEASCGAKEPGKPDTHLYLVSIGVNEKRETVYHCTWPNKAEDGLPFACHFQGKKQLVQRHIASPHLQWRPFICEFVVDRHPVTGEAVKCGARFPQKNAWKAHYHNHLGIKPLLCPYPDCPKKFNDESRKQRHMTKDHNYVAQPTQRQHRPPKNHAGTGYYDPVQTQTVTVPLAKRPGEPLRPRDPNGHDDL